MYTISFMLGETLDEVGKLMLDPDITELINNYQSSIFSKDQNYDKIRYIQDAINSTARVDLQEKYTKLLEKAVAADEVRILGRILKINQGLPTNTADTYSYIKNIEKYIESRFNKDLIDAVNEAQRQYVLARKNEDSKIARQFSTQVKRAKKYLEEHWEYFDLIKFILDPQYKQESINKYEAFKVNFNILEVIDQVPHFKEMFNVLALNKQILNSLSIRNRLEDIVWNQIKHKTESGKKNVQRPLNKAEIWDLKDRVDKHLINSWISSKGITVTLPANPLTNPAEKTVTLKTPKDIEWFKTSYIEEYAIPLLKEKLPENRFISLLTFGLKNNEPFYKLPFNMVQIDNTQKTRSLYEEALYAFNNLNNIKIDGIDMNLVDLFYLYNLIVNQDKFGPNSLTRIFEDLLSADGSERLLVSDFNNWIDKQDIKQLVDTFDYESLSMTESVPVIEDNNIGFKEEPLDIDIEEAAVEEGTTVPEKTMAELWSMKEGWSIEYFNKKVKPKLNEAWQIEYELSDDQESPVDFEGTMSFKYEGNQRPGMIAESTLEAIRLGERTATTRYESDGHIDYWKSVIVGNRIKFKSGNDFVIVEVTKPLTKLVPEATTQPNLFAQYYDTTPSVESKLIALVKEANMKNLHLVYDSDLIGEDSAIRNAKGFIRNGEVYINADRATDDTVIHELGHLYLADAKLQHPNEYYQLLAKVRSTPIWKSMRAIPEYANKRGSDFDEEVLASMISGVDGIAGTDMYKIVLEALNLVSNDYKEFLKSDILPTLSDTFIDNYREQQKLATIKNKLIEKKVIKENCK